MPTPGPKATALMAYLASQREGCAARSELAVWLWSEGDAAASRQALRQCIFRLRDWLGDWVHVLEADREAVRLNLGEVEIDLRNFEKLIKDERCFDPIAAARLCQGSFCAGLDVAEEPVEQWLRRRRGELDRLAARAFAGAAEHAVARADADAAIEFARRRVAIDPFDETAQAVLIGICMHFGRYGEARAVYQVCREEFRDELGVAPGQDIEAALKVRPPQDLVPLPAVSAWAKARRQEVASRARVDRKVPGRARLTGAVAATLLAAVLSAGEWGRDVERQDAPVMAARMWVSAEDVSPALPVAPVSKEVADYANRVALEVAPAEAVRRALRGEAKYAQLYPTGC
jgi:DNA-binding SARP family transcriptional activator